MSALRQPVSDPPRRARRVKTTAEPITIIDEPMVLDEPSAVLIEPDAALILYVPAQVIETVNLTVAMAGLSIHTRRAYQRWIKQYLAEVTDMDPHKFVPEAVPIPIALTSLGAANLKAWLGRLKSHNLGKQSIGQAKASVIWLAQLLADMERAEHSMAAGLSRVKAPRAEAGQRTGSWLTVDEVRQLLRGARVSAHTPPAAARNAAIVGLLAMCGLRREEITRLTWGDLHKQGPYRVLAVHGKGAKRRQIKLPGAVAELLDNWRGYHADSDNSTARIFTRILKSGLVTPFGMTDKAVRLIVQLAATAAGTPNIAPHDLRRSFARGAYEAGASFELIRQSLGHSNIATTERYVNSALELGHAATDIWADVLKED